MSWFLTGLSCLHLNPAMALEEKVMFEIEKANRRATGGREDISDLQWSLAE